MTVAITGASGALGRATAELVLRAVDPREVVLTTRTPDALADLAALGADVRRADFGDPSTLRTAFAGVERLLLVSTDAVGARLDQQRAAVAAAAGAGVRHVAYTSVPEPVPANPALVVPDHAGTEQALRDSGLRWTMLRNNLYAHMQVSTIEQAAAAGRLVTNAGSGAAAYVTREDCAAVAAAVLTQDGHENVAYDVTGPAALTAADLAALAGAEGVDVEPVDDDTFRAGLLGAGLPAEAADVVTSFGAAIRGGFAARVTSTVADLTGRAPTALGDVLAGAYSR
ncbi:NAD(P)H-binding protein [Actinophytocola gossypii]|uniref:NmrA family NAD(P)-binding protein n=1 Tax=Actinophytocola gossypii TaxID=2812003 RepID=A0ABT2J4G6_9PSEU|nr:NAD(P)H-binding protein [Actinophytocola gossypii]MCT2582743.1 NmrA family NAD(P)-binding protein [Actinophytocola gossypii]